MKTCPNCRVVHADDFRGQCQECGAPMGNVQGSASGDLAFRYAKQVSEQQGEVALEQRMKRGNYDGVKIPDTLLSVARGFVIEREVPDEGEE